MSLISSPDVVVGMGVQSDTGAFDPPLSVPLRHGSLLSRMHAPARSTRREVKVVGRLKALIPPSSDRTRPFAPCREIWVGYQQKKNPQHDREMERCVAAD